VQSLQSWLRRRRWWLELREIQREGWGDAWRRFRIQRRILTTPPVRTGRGGDVEVRVLTWRRDWVNMLWALKSFYYYARVDFPLYIHDGGLARGQAEQLLHHFPDAVLVSEEEADALVETALRQRSLVRCLEYRRKNPSTRKLFDFAVLGRTDYLLSIDSDIVFFRRPDLLLPAPGQQPCNRYNEDSAYWYSMTLDELEAAFGIRPPPRINSGLALIRRESLDLPAVERWLENPKLFADAWVTEQTLHALSATVAGVELLPASYCVSTERGFPEDVICKHYPGYFRPLLYQEGMKRLVAAGFLSDLRQWASRGQIQSDRAVKAAVA